MCGVVPEALEFLPVGNPLVTRPLAHLVYELCKITTHKAVGLLMGLHQGTVKAIDCAMMERVQAERPLERRSIPDQEWAAFSCLSWLGAQTALQRRQERASGDLETGRHLQNPALLRDFLHQTGQGGLPQHAVFFSPGLRHGLPGFSKRSGNPVNGPSSKQRSRSARSCPCRTLP